MYIMFSTPLTCSSMGAATASATSWALAPGYWQVTETVGGEMLGNWARGRVKTAMPPARVMTMDSTEAKMGRSVKKREIKAVPPLSCPPLPRSGGEGRDIAHFAGDV